MRRWNGWGDDATSVSLGEGGRAMISARLGPGRPGRDATQQEILAQIPASRLPANALIQTDAATRLSMAMGESFADWLRKRFGALPPVPDGVAFPESGEQVRELLDLAQECNWIVIPFAGGTSVAGHLDCPVSERPILSINFSRMNRLLHLDKASQLATFGAGTPGPLVEAQLRAQGYTLGHFPQSFEYSTVGGWVVTRSSGQQSLRYGRIEQLFVGGRLESPLGTLSIPTLPAASAGPYLRNTLWELGYSADTIETAVDWPQVKNLMLAMEQASRDVFAQYDERVHAFSHLSHLYPQGSSIYSQFVWATAAGGFAPNFERWQRLKAAVAATIAAHGGTVSHQHGVGRDHAAHLVDEKGPLGMATLAALCHHFDPKKIMNPGKLLQDGGPWAS